jgi:hypothetical protein
VAHKPLGTGAESDRLLIAEVLKIYTLSFVHVPGRWRYAICSRE